MARHHLTTPESAATIMSSFPTSKAAMALALFEGGKKAYDSGTSYWRRNFAYTVTISEKDILYDDVHHWVLSILPDEKHRSLMVESNRHRGHYDDMEATEDEADRGQPSRPLKLKFDDTKARTVYIDGHKISVRVHVPEAASSSGNGYIERRYSEIEFTGSTYASQQAVLGHLTRLNESRATVRKAVLRMVNQWGSWTTRSDLPARTLDSVALPGDQKNRIVSDLDKFLSSEDKYNRLALPWHRGYMFHGPPGTGKTSLIKALANHFNLDLWYISLADLKAESSLLGLLSEVGPRSILLLEDIDTMKITQDPDGAQQGEISMSSLLNTLDGVATPHGLVTVMTTNRFEVLNPALTREGRMDMIEELGYPTPQTLGALYSHFYDRTPSWIDKTSDPSRTCLLPRWLRCSSVTWTTRLPLKPKVWI